MIKRYLFQSLQNHLEKKEITFIAGPRQAGKTTLMMLLKEQLEKQGKKTVFLNLDIESDRQFFISQGQLIRKIALEIGDKEGYVFMDEIQRKEDAGVFLKGLYDMNLPYKFIVSGSGSVELKEHIHESLAGRKRMFELTTVTFMEFVDFKTDYKYEGKLFEFFALEKERTRGLFEEYLNFGGYPRVVLEETREEKRKVIAELYQSYVERDIAYLLGVQKTEDFTALVKIMASQIGSLVNISELSGTLGLSVATIKNYLWYMQKTYLLEKVTPFFRNVRKEITKSPMYYFYDLGMRNYTLGTFGNAVSTGEVGHLFENFIFNILKEKIKDTASQIHFWRTKDKGEVDFILSSGLKVIPIEVKYSQLKNPETTRSFQSFLSKYSSPKGYIIHLGTKMVDKIAGATVYFLPYYELLSPSSSLDFFTMA